MRMNRLFLLCMACLLTCVQVVYAQTRISGRVTDPNGAGLEGVTVQVKGTNRGVVTTAGGNFSIQAPASGTLIYSFTGYRTQEVAIGASADYNVKLEAEVNALDNVVVIGYGTVSKKDLTGSVAQVKATALEKENPVNIQEQLRGNIPGLQVASGGAGAKDNANLVIRGKGSINSSINPLYVVDGAIYNGDINDINPNNIATIDVLKDASAAAIYGSRSANGVIIITTKRGNKAKPTVTFNSFVGANNVFRAPQLFQGEDFLHWRTQVYNSTDPTHPVGKYDDPRNLPAGVSLAAWRAYDTNTGDDITIWLTRIGAGQAVQIANYKAGKATNWQGLAERTGLSQDHNVSVSARSENMSYYFAGGMTRNEGPIVGDEYKVYRFQANLDAKVAKFLTLGFNSTYSVRDESGTPVLYGPYNDDTRNAPPYGSVFTDDGTQLRDSPNDDIGSNGNPLRDYYYENKLNRTNSLWAHGYARGQLPYGFSFDISFTPTMQSNIYFDGHSSKDVNYRATNGYATRANYNMYDWLSDFQLSWNKTFGKHKFNATVVQEAGKFQSWKTQIIATQFLPSDILSYHNILAASSIVADPTLQNNIPLNNIDIVSTTDAILGRLIYSYNDKYLFTASVRRDGNSVFGAANKRGTFPSAAVGWVFSDESFLKGSRSWLDYGKLRLSYGEVGNSAIGAYDALSKLTGGQYQYLNSGGTLNVVSQLFTNSLGNPNLRWEFTRSEDLGVDFSLFHNRVSGSVDIYNRDTRNLILNRALPDVTGFGSIVDNLGQINNRGIEVNLSTTIMDRPNFSWSMAGTFSYNRNKIIHLYGEVPVYDATGKITGTVEKDDPKNKLFIGQGLQTVWDQQVVGVWQTGDAAAAALVGQKPGDTHVLDVNGDNKYSDADRLFLGQLNPKFSWAMRNDFTIYKNWSASFQLVADIDYLQPYNIAKNSYAFLNRTNGYNVPYWTADNPTNDAARLQSNDGAATYSWYHDASNIRLANATISYSLPKSMLQRIRFERAQIYVTGNNLALFAPHFATYNPSPTDVNENAGNQSDRAKQTTFTVRSIKLGVNLSF